MNKWNFINWKEFKIIDIFSIEKGTRIKKQDRKNGDIKLKTAGEYNLGYKQKISSDKNKLFNSPCITIDMFGNVFPSDEEFYADDNVHILLNENLNLNNSLFISAILKILKNKYSYSRQLRIERLKKEIIILPANSQNEPDWKFMSDFINQKAEKINFKCKLKTKEYKLKLNSTQWKEFKINDIFNIYGSGKSKTFSQIKDGKYNYVTTQATLNGIKAKSDFYNNLGNLITIDSATNGIVFYQENPFVASDHIEILKLRNFSLNKFIALFLITILRTNMHLYNYGRKRSQTRLKKEVISLPVNDNDKPDWEFMENYIKQKTKNIYF